MQNKLGQYYNDLPTWSKGVVAVIGLAGIALIGYSIYSGSKRRRDIKEANKASEEAKIEISELSRVGVKPSYSPSQYEVFSQKLVQAMDSCGTGEESIYSVFRYMKNKADVLSLISAFGVRFYQPCSATNPISYTKWLFDDKSFGGGLATWLEYDLTSSEIKKINDILAKSNIQYSF